MALQPHDRTGGKSLHYEIQRALLTIGVTPEWRRGQLHITGDPRDRAMATTSLAQVSSQLAHSAIWHDAEEPEDDPAPGCPECGGDRDWMYHGPLFSTRCSLCFPESRAAELSARSMTSESERAWFDRKVGEVSESWSRFESNRFPTNSWSNRASLSLGNIVSAHLRVPESRPDGFQIIDDPIPPVSAVKLPKNAEVRPIGHFETNLLSGWWDVSREDLAKAGQEVGGVDVGQRQGMTELNREPQPTSKSTYGLRVTCPSRAGLYP